MPPNHGVTETELAGLSDAERAALAEDDTPPEGGDEDDDPPATPATPATPAADAKPDAEVVVEERVEAEEGSPFAVPFHHDAKIDPTKVDARIGELQKQYDDGNLDLPDFLKQRDALREVLLKDQIKAEVSDQSQEQVAVALWQRARDDFLDSNPAYKNDGVLYRSLDAEVKRLAGDEASANLSDKQLLTRAHEEVAKRMRVAEAPKPAADPKKDLAEKRKTDRTDVPRTLADVPVAAEAESVDGEFSHLDKLQGAAFERALAALKPDQVERYLSAQGA